MTVALIESLAPSVCDAVAAAEADAATVRDAGDCVLDGEAEVLDVAVGVKVDVMGASTMRASSAAACHTGTQQAMEGQSPAPLMNGVE